MRNNGISNDKKFIEKIEGKYKKQVPRNKINLSRSVNSFVRIESVSDKLRII